MDTDQDNLAQPPSLVQEHNVHVEGARAWAGDSWKDLLGRVSDPANEIAASEHQWKCALCGRDRTLRRRDHPVHGFKSICNSCAVVAQHEKARRKVRPAARRPAPTRPQDSMRTDAQQNNMEIAGIIPQPCGPSEATRHRSSRRGSGSNPILTGPTEPPAATDISQDVEAASVLMMLGNAESIQPCQAPQAGNPISSQHAGQNTRSLSSVIAQAQAFKPLPPLHPLAAHPGNSSSSAAPAVGAAQAPTADAAEPRPATKPDEPIVINSDSDEEPCPSQPRKLRVPLPWVLQPPVNAPSPPQPHVAADEACAPLPAPPRRAEVANGSCPAPPLSSAEERESRDAHKAALPWQGAVERQGSAERQGLSNPPSSEAGDGPAAAPCSSPVTDPAPTRADTTTASPCADTAAGDSGVNKRRRVTSDEDPEPATRAFQVTVPQPAVQAPPPLRQAPPMPVTHSMGPPPPRTAHLAPRCRPVPPPAPSLATPQQSSHDPRAQAHPTPPLPPRPAGRVLLRSGNVHITASPCSPPPLPNQQQARGPPNCPPLQPPSTAPPAPPPPRAPTNAATAPLPPICNPAGLSLDSMLTELQEHARGIAANHDAFAKHALGLTAAMASESAARQWLHTTTRLLAACALQLTCGADAVERSIMTVSGTIASIYEGYKAVSTKCARDVQQQQAASNELDRRAQALANEEARVRAMASQARGDPCPYTAGTSFGEQQRGEPRMWGLQLAGRCEDNDSRTIQALRSELVAQKALAEEGDRARREHENASAFWQGKCHEAEETIEEMRLEHESGLGFWQGKCRDAEEKLEHMRLQREKATARWQSKCRSAEDKIKHMRDEHAAIVAFWQSKCRAAEERLERQMREPAAARGSSPGGSATMLFPAEARLEQQMLQPAAARGSSPGGHVTMLFSGGGQLEQQKRESAAAATSSSSGVVTTGQQSPPGDRAPWCPVHDWAAGAHSFSQEQRMAPADGMPLPAMVLPLAPQQRPEQQNCEPKVAAAGSLSGSVATCQPSPPGYRAAWRTVHDREAEAHGYSPELRNACADSAALPAEVHPSPADAWEKDAAQVMAEGDGASQCVLWQGTLKADVALKASAAVKMVPCQQEGSLACMAGV